MKSLRACALFLGAMMFAGVLASATPRAIATANTAAAYDDHDKDKAYQDGYKHGAEDARHHKSAYAHSEHWKHTDERHSYEEGYRAGYQSIAGTGYVYPEQQPVVVPPGTPVVVEQQPVVVEHEPAVLPNGAASAHEIGYQDGLVDGRGDRAGGHDYRPSDTDNYHHADRGYADAMGSKDTFKAQYREGYADGYRKGYDKH